MNDGDLPFLTLSLGPGEGIDSAYGEPNAGADLLINPPLSGPAVVPRLQAMGALVREQAERFLTEVNSDGKPKMVAGDLVYFVDATNIAFICKLDDDSRIQLHPNAASNASYEPSQVMLELVEDRVGVIDNIVNQPGFKPGLVVAIFKESTTDQIEKAGSGRGADRHWPGLVDEQLMRLCKPGLDVLVVTVRIAKCKFRTTKKSYNAVKRAIERGEYYLPATDTGCVVIEPQKDKNARGPSGNRHCFFMSEGGAPLGAGDAEHARKSYCGYDDLALGMAIADAQRSLTGSPFKIYKRNGRIAVSKDGMGNWNAQMQADLITFLSQLGAGITLVIAWRRAAELSTGAEAAARRRQTDGNALRYRRSAQDRDNNAYKVRLMQARDVTSVSNNADWSVLKAQLYDDVRKLREASDASSDQAPELNAHADSIAAFAGVTGDLNKNWEHFRAQLRDATITAMNTANDGVVGGKPEFKEFADARADYSKAAMLIVQVKMAFELFTTKGKELHAETERLLVDEEEDEKEDVEEGDEEDALLRMLASASVSRVREGYERDGLDAVVVKPRDLW